MTFSDLHLPNIIVCWFHFQVCHMVFGLCPLLIFPFRDVSLTIYFYLSNAYWSNGCQRITFSRSSSTTWSARPTSSRSTSSCTLKFFSPTPIAETLTAEEAALLRRFRSSSTRSSLPPKTSKIEPEPAWQEFLQALSAKNIELSDLDYNLQQELQTSEQGRADFLASTSPFLMLSIWIQNKQISTHWAHQEEAIYWSPINYTNSWSTWNSNQRDWCNITRTPSCPTTLCSLKCANNFIPKPPSSTTTTTSYWTPWTPDKTLESKIGNKALLLRGLPAVGFTKNNRDRNSFFWCQSRRSFWLIHLQLHHRCRLQHT